MASSEVTMKGNCVNHNEGGGRNGTEGQNGHSTSTAKGMRIRLITQLHSERAKLLFFSCSIILRACLVGCVFLDAEAALYKELWHACAGPLVTGPREGERVFYFPQGHIEQVIN